MKNALIGIVAVAGLASAASAQTFVLGPQQIEYRIVADNLVVDQAVAGDNFVQLALQVRYNGGNPLAASLGATRGGIRSGEADTAGILDRTWGRTGPFGNVDFSNNPVNPAQRRVGMTDGHRELFAGALPANNAPQNGGNPNLADLNNTFNGGGEFRWAAGLAGFQNILAFDNATTGVGRPDTSGDGEFISVGLQDDTNGVDGPDTGLEPLFDGGGSDVARWDTIFLFNYTVTNFATRTISFDYANLGSTANPGTTEETMQWWNAATQNFSASNTALGLYRDDLSDNISVIAVPAPGAIALLGLGGLVAGRRRRA